ncbi:tape measure protein [Fusibacter tunisiensis]|uniref:tape measure protein n=1 Tax=Fusibacter tunisiensis TaxID=1008308 RepID=UPI00311C992B
MIEGQLRRVGDILGTLRSAIRIQDGMSPAFRSMNSTMNMVISSFEALNNASSSAIDTRTIQAARTELNKAEMVFNEIEQSISAATNQQEKFNQVQRNTTNGANALLGKFKGIAVSLGLAFGGRQIIQLSDEMTSTTARLNLMNDGLQTTAELQEKIFQSAQKSRTSYMDTASAVSKLGILAKEAFGSNDEMIFFAEQINKQFKIGGSSISESTNAMYQLTQAMAAGRLQGDEFRSIMENAPLLAQSIAEYMGKSVGELRKMSSEGLITADVIKNALFASADQTNQKFSELPMTFGQVATIIGNTMLQTFEPVIQTIGRGAQVIYDNWSTIEPVFWGLAVAVGFYAVAMGLSAAATWLAVQENRALIATMLSNPILWVAIAIGILIGIIYKWVQSVGGIKVAWMITMNVMLTAWDGFKIAIMTGVYGVLNMWDMLTVGLMIVGVGIANIMGDMKANVLTILQNMVNGAIGIINDFISLLNKIPGVSIGMISEVTFGSAAQLENEAEKQARNASLEGYRTSIDSKVEERNAKLLTMQTDAINANATRQAEINAAKVDALANKNEETFMKTAEIADNTGSMKDSMELSAEELKYLREISERDVINRFTTAEIKIDMKNEMAVNSELDIDGVVTKLEERLYESMSVAAEGVYE